MNLLPGLRELRAPLVSGYLWLLSAWLLLGRMEWLPSQRPPGNGEIARLWDLGGTLGKTVVLAVVTFVAYLIGSFFEISPDGQIADILRPLVLVDRRPWYRGISGDRIRYAKAMLEELGFRYNYQTGLMVSQSISSEARRDLEDLSISRNVIPSASNDWVMLATEAARKVGEESLFDKAKLQDVADKGFVYSMAHEAIAARVIEEMQQLASRLLVKNQNLYGKYDRQMAEASVRMNISIPLTALLLLATWLSDLPLWARLVLTLLSLAFGFMLLRQGFLRAMSARDVIVQALAIGEVQSRYIPEEPSKNLAEKPADSERPTLGQIEDRRSADKP